MIKEKKKITKYNYKKSTQEIINEYLRTIGLSILAAVVITTALAINARSEMIKNLYANEAELKKMDKQIAMQIIERSDLTNDLQNKTYMVCMHVGDLYNTAGDYENAQKAFELAVQKAKTGVYKPYAKLIPTLVNQEKFKEAEDVLNSIKDHTNRELIKFKTRSYIVIGDKYYSMGKPISAAKSYEHAKFYYDKFSKKDKFIDEAIVKRIVRAYVQSADIMVKSGYNSEAIRFLKKAEKYMPDDTIIKYKLAIVLADTDPEKSVEYFEPLLEKIPQDIDYGVYDSALMKAANIADLDDRPTKAKYYRYRIHSIDMFITRKVVYKNDIETNLTAFNVRKALFTYPLRATYSFKNVSNNNIINLMGDFVLCRNDKPVETITRVVSDKDKPLLMYEQEPNSVNIKFKKAIFSKKDLEDYTIKVYLYKDEKYKTLVFESTIPVKSFDLSK